MNELLALGIFLLGAGSGALLNYIARCARNSPDVRQSELASFPSTLSMHPVNSTPDVPSSTPLP
jgi:hypothetical protein